MDWRNENGEYLYDITDMKDGWLLVGDKFYYVLNGHVIQGRKAQIDGKWYSFDFRGQMMENALCPFTNYMTYTDTADRNSYYKEDGSRANYTGWKLINQKWCYFDNNSKCLEGWAVLNGNRYYFKSYFDVSFAKKSDDTAGEMCTGYQTINGRLYYFSQDGVCQGVCGPQNGWYYADGDWYYMKGLHLCTGEWNDLYRSS